MSYDPIANAVGVPFHCVWSHQGQVKITEVILLSTEDITAYTESDWIGEIVAEENRIGDLEEAKAGVSDSSEYRLHAVFAGSPDFVFQN